VQEFVRCAIGCDVADCLDRATINRFTQPRMIARGEIHVSAV